MVLHFIYVHMAMLRAYGYPTLHLISALPSERGAGELEMESRVREAGERTSEAIGTLPSHLGHFG